MLEVVSGVGMGVRVGGAGNRGDDVVSSGGDVGVAGGGARWRDCCRFPEDNFGQLWEDPPYCLPYTLILAMSFCRLAWKEKVVKVAEALTDQRAGRRVEGVKV